MSDHDPRLEAARAELAPGGTLRVAVNASNIVLVQVDQADGTLSGVVPVLARALADRLGVGLDLVSYPGPGLVSEAIPRAEWDVCFLAIEPVRAAQIAFTAPYVLIEGTYLVTDASPLHGAAEVDRPGMRIGVGKGTAYDLFLSRTLAHATLTRTVGNGTLGEMLLDGGVDALAGVRQALDRLAGELGGVRVMRDRFMIIQQAAGTLPGRPAGLAYLTRFIEDARASGLVERALRESGQDPGLVAPPG